MDGQPDDQVITSVTNARVKELVALRRRRARAGGRTVVEGREELELALNAGVQVLEAYHCPELAGSSADHAALVARLRADGIPLFRLGEAAFAKAAYRQGPDGVLAVVAAPGTPLPDPSVGGSGLFLVCEAVEKPGNLGAMLRSADAAGVQGVIAADPVGDWANPNVIRASKGAVFSVPVHAASTVQTVQFLTAAGVELVAATPQADVLYTDVDLSGPVAVAVGAEKHGLSPELLAAARHRVRIPMAGQVDSLNVATSAALLLFESVRQRGLVG